MKKFNIFKYIFIYIFAILLISAGDETKQYLYGNSAFKADKNLTIQDMLTYAIQYEYLERSQYQTIIAKFENIKPFSNIIKAEETHIKWIEDAFKKYKLSIPKDEAKKYIKIPDSLTKAYKFGVLAQIENIAMYERFLETHLIKSVAYSDLQTLFTNLKNASQNHLEALRSSWGNNFQISFWLFQRFYNFS